MSAIHQFSPNTPANQNADTDEIRLAGRYAIKTDFSDLNRAQLPFSESGSSPEPGSAAESKYAFLTWINHKISTFTK